MSIHVNIIPPKGLPDPYEKIISVATVRGSLLNATEEVGYDRLDKLDSPKKACFALLCVIEEADKGEDGIFNFEYWKEVTQRWDGCREFDKNLKEFRRLEQNLPLTAEKMTSRFFRQRLRDDAFRFMSYYMMGYEVQWER